MKLAIEVYPEKLENTELKLVNPELKLVDPELKLVTKAVEDPPEVETPVDEPETEKPPPPPPVVVSWGFGHSGALEMPAGTDTQIERNMTRIA